MPHSFHLLRIDTIWASFGDHSTASPWRRAVASKLQKKDQKKCINEYLVEGLACLCSSSTTTNPPLSPAPSTHSTQSCRIGSPDSDTRSDDKSALAPTGSWSSRRTPPVRAPFPFPVPGAVLLPLSPIFLSLQDIPLQAEMMLKPGLLLTLFALQEATGRPTERLRSTARCREDSSNAAGSDTGGSRGGARGLRAARTTRSLTNGARTRRGRRPTCELAFDRFLVACTSRLLRAAVIEVL